MFTCRRITDVEYYQEESAKVRAFQVGKSLQQTKEALDAGDLDRAREALAGVQGAAILDAYGLRRVTVRLRRELWEAWQAIGRGETEVAEVRLELIEAVTGSRRDPEAGQRDRAAYYLDNGAGEDKGVWWSPKRRVGIGMPSLIRRGGEVESKAFRALAAGIDPRTGQPMIQDTKSSRTAGYDLQFGAPKSVSALWAVSSQTVRHQLEQAHRTAVHRALDFAHEEGLIVARRGAGGCEQEVPEDYAVAEFVHTTSRAGDPQLHSHAVLLNACVRGDGSTGTLDNRALLDFQGAMGAVYRTELAASLEREFGLSIRKDERNFLVEGVPTDLIQAWSKRRVVIEAAAREAGYDTANDRERAGMAAVATRDKKSDVPDREQLEDRWTGEVRALGWTRDAVWDSARAARTLRDAQAAEQGINLATWHASRRVTVAKEGLAALEEHDAVLERRHVLREVIERQQGLGSADEALEEVRRITADNLTLIGRVRTGAVYATPAMIETEWRMLNGAQQRRGEREFVAAERIEAAIASRPSMSEEQAEAVRHALNRDGVSVIEGSAGTGKSFSLGSVADAARNAGLHVYVVAPSHKAKSVVAHDTTTDETSAKAVKGFINRLGDKRHSDHIALTDRHCVIVDEAGMVGTRELESVLRHAQQAGAKVILAGDTRQLQPVAAGSPMSAIARLVGTQRISEIRRQKVDWQREASMAFATSAADRGIEAYDRRDRLILERGSDATMAALARDWQADVERTTVAEDQPSSARLVLAGRNREVHDLNLRLRDVYRLAGRLSEDEVEVRAVTRGKRAQLTALHLSVGERIVFGENVNVDGITINNSDMGTVTGITADADPVVMVDLDKGGRVRAPWSQYASRPRNGIDEVRHPHCQHAYAVTVHTSQGTTVDRSYVYNGSGMGAESGYVAMTRHRLDARMYADESRVVDHLRSNSATRSIAISSAGQAGAQDAEDEDTPKAGDEVVREDIVTVLKRELMRSDSKLNVSDFQQDVASWARTPWNPFPPVIPKSVHHYTSDQMSASLALVDEMVAEGAQSRNKGNRRNKPVNRGGKAPAENTEKRSESQRTADFVWSLHAFGQRMLGGATVQGAVLAQRIDGRKRENALRAHVVEKRPVGNASAVRLSQVAAAKVGGSAKTTEFARVRRIWNIMLDELNPWLMSAKGIAREILETFRADIRTEGTRSKDNPGGSCFAHRNETGEIVGYMRMGPRRFGGDPTFGIFSCGGKKLITRMGACERPAVVYVGDTSIDLLSAYQRDGQPKGAMLCSLDGGSSHDAMMEIAKLAVRHPDAEFLIAFQNDLFGKVINPHAGDVATALSVGERMARRVEAAIMAVAPNTNFRRHFPPAEFKNWNDAVRGGSRELTELQKLARDQTGREAVYRSLPSRRNEFLEGQDSGRLHPTTLANNQSWSNIEEAGLQSLRQDLMIGDQPGQQEVRIREEQERLRKLQEELAQANEQPVAPSFRR